MGRTILFIVGYLSLLLGLGISQMSFIEDVSDPNITSKLLYGAVNRIITKLGRWNSTSSFEIGFGNLYHQSWGYTRVVKLDSYANVRIWTPVRIPYDATFFLKFSYAFDPYDAPTSQFAASIGSIRIY